MPELGTPFSGFAHDRQLANEELVRAIRFSIAAEYEALPLSMRLAESKDSVAAVAVLSDSADEERVRAGVSRRLLTELAPDEKESCAEGAAEVEEELKEPEEAATGAQA